MKAPDYEIINCVECNAEVLEHKLHEHIEAVHVCPFCGCKPERLEIHLEFFHLDETDRVREDAHEH